jgi:hypothetical protein
MAASTADAAPAVSVPHPRSRAQRARSRSSTSRGCRPRLCGHMAEEKTTIPHCQVQTRVWMDAAMELPARQKARLRFDHRQRQPALARPHVRPAPPNTQERTPPHRHARRIAPTDRRARRGRPYSGRPPCTSEAVTASCASKTGDLPASERDNGCGPDNPPRPPSFRFPYRRRKYQRAAAREWATIEAATS